MSKRIEFEGKQYDVPQDATMDEIDSYIKSQNATAAPKGQAPDPRTATEVMQDQAANVLRGIPTAVTGIPGAVKSTYEALRDIVTGQGTGKAQQLIGGMVQPIMPILKTAASSPLIGGRGVGDPSVPAPDSPEWSQAAQGAGNLLGSAALSSGSEAIAPAMKTALEKSAVKEYTRALAPTTVEMKTRAARAIPEMIDRGVTGSLESLGKQADAAVEAAGKQREAALRAHTQTQINTRPVLKAIDQSLRDNRIVIQDPTTGQPKVMNPAMMTAANSMKKAIQQFGPALSADTLDKVKQYFQNVVQESGVYGGHPNIGLSKRIMADATSALSEELHSAAPDIAKIDAEYTVWRNLQQVVDSTLLRKSSQGFPLRELTTALAGGSAGYLTHGLGGGVVGAAALGTLALAVKSPLWRTVSAVTKDRLAGLLANGDLRTAALLVSRLNSQQQVNPEQASQGQKQ